jgi:DnaK suppressor protein
MEQGEVGRLRQKLEFQRHETWQVLCHMEREAKSLDVEASQDSADRCVISPSKESLCGRISQRRTVLGLIEAALERIADGSFGICVGCSDKIKDQRLQALPWTQFCLRCQGELEQKSGASLSARTPISVTATSRRAG